MTNLRWNHALGIALAIVSFWLAWPVLALQTFPNIPDRGWAAMALIISANLLVRWDER
jgi:hypothetical protein